MQLILYSSSWALRSVVTTREAALGDRWSWVILAFVKDLALNQWWDLMLVSKLPNWGKRAQIQESWHILDWVLCYCKETGILIISPDRTFNALKKRIDNKSTFYQEWLFFFWTFHWALQSGSWKSRRFHIHFLIIFSKLP